MVLAANPYDERATRRILEFCEDATPWSRRLWQSSTMLTARELLEAGNPSMSASERAMKTLQDELLARVMNDPGASVAANRNTVRKMLAVPTSSLVQPGHAWHVLGSWTSATRSSYLENWAAALDSGVGLPSAECAARLIGAHLLDEGFSQTYVHRWLTYRVKHASAVVTLAEMCRELQAKLMAGPQSIDVLVPLAAHAPLPRPIPAGWLTTQQVRDWRAHHIPNWRPIRQHGAMLLTVEALDVFAAADIVRTRVTTIRDRFRVGGRHEIVPAASMWLAGVAEPQATLPPSRRVEVYAFERQTALWSHSVRSDIEAAIELLAPLERGPAPAAVTGAWAAIESLLIGPGDQNKHIAADRISLIVAGGHLRAELTSLAWAHAGDSNDALAADIKAQPTNQERAQLIVSYLAAGGHLNLVRHHDSYALERVQAGLSDPHAYVDSVRRSIEPTMRGLYRQRNLLSHAGGTSAVAIRPTLERAAPLVAAGLDRIVHLGLTSHRSALDLAAQAEVRLEALRGQPAASALTLLDA